MGNRGGQGSRPCFLGGSSIPLDPGAGPLHLLPSVALPGPVHRCPLGNLPSLGGGAGGGRRQRGWSMAAGTAFSFLHDLLKIVSLFFPLKPGLRCCLCPAQTSCLTHGFSLPGCLPSRPSGATPGWPLHLGRGRSRWETQQPGRFSAWLFYPCLVIGLLLIISWQQRQGGTQLFKP